MMCERLQRKRTKGFKISDVCDNPNGYVFVGRPSKYGNPWTNDGEKVVLARDKSQIVVIKSSEEEARLEAVHMFRKYHAPSLDLSDLIGKDVVCWCPIDRVCHGDILLELVSEGDNED